MDYKLESETMLSDKNKLVYKLCKVSFLVYMKPCNYIVSLCTLKIQDHSYDHEMKSLYISYRGNH